MLRHPPLNSAVAKMIAEAKKTPYFHLSGYQQRYWVTPNPKENEKQALSARIHIYERADEDRHFHDHPFESISLVLHGWFMERLPGDQAQDPALDSVNFTTRLCQPGDVIYRKATDRHQITHISGTAQTVTMFIAGPWEQDWGFYPPTGKVYWREYLNQWGNDLPPGESGWANT